MKTFYITTSIAYVNAPPHIGFALELIQADVIARSQREKQTPVFFLTGTDEHGVKIVRAAEAAGLSVQKFVDENAKKYESLKEILNISSDDFIRTSDQKKHWPQVIDLWNKMSKAGDLYKKKYKGLYCIGHEAFVTEKDLIQGKCVDHGKEPEIIEEENYFFRLSKYANRVAEKIKSGEIKIIPQSRANEILKFIEQGIEDISFSRPRKDLSWGIPVPGDETQTIYVWADALANYLYPQKFWPASVQVMGKDILRFHALYWPAMLLSANLPLPETIFVHGHITADGKKISKTLGNIIDPVELVKKYGIDPVRYYLLREIPATNDGDFSYEKFEERYNADLANGLGNFAARVLALANEYEFKTNSTNIDVNIEKEIKKIKDQVYGSLNDFKFSDALAAIWELIKFGDIYVNERKPWDKEGISDKKQETVFNLVILLDNIAALLKPFLPEAAEKLTSVINWQNGKLEIKKLQPLFPRLYK